MIEIQNISKKYGDKYAVKDATFTIKKGEILGFLGRNGAGKSTTMNIVTGYISATSGRVLLGFNLQTVAPDWLTLAPRGFCAVEE